MPRKPKAKPQAQPVPFDPPREILKALPAHLMELVEAMESLASDPSSAEAGFQTALQDVINHVGSYAAPVQAEAELYWAALVRLRVLERPSKLPPDVTIGGVGFNVVACADATAPDWPCPEPPIGMPWGLEPAALGATAWAIDRVCWDLVPEAYLTQEKDGPPKLHMGCVREAVRMAEAAGHPPVVPGITFVQVNP